MPIPAVTRERIAQALEEFDANLRNTPEWQGWEERGSQKFVLEANGRRYPPKKVVSIATGALVSAFSGGKPTNSYLRERGFEIRTLRPMAISEILDRILREYPQARLNQQFGATAPMYVAFEKARAALAVDEVVGGRETLKVDASAGAGKWARVPWIAFLDSRETETTQKGVYVVILFRQDGSGVYVTFNQGVTEPIRRLGNVGGIAELRQRAEQLRQKSWCRALANAGFLLDNSIDLRADPGLGRDYEASTIAHKFYARGEVPNDEELLSDLSELLTAYEAFLSRAEEVQLIHLLLKWSDTREPRTIQLHNDVVQREGSVWWGKFGAGLGQTKIEQLQSQVAAGHVTYVFLVGDNTTWRTRLSQITADRAEVDDRRLPGYYSRDDCSVFVRLSDFAEVGTPWLLANTVLDARPEPGSTKSTLSSQSAFAYLRIVERAWIFQANPQFFDVRGAISQLQEMRWLAKRYANEMRLEDKVYVWESGPNAGIVAVAKIIETAQEVESDPGSLPFVRSDQEFGWVQPRVRIQILKAVDPYLSRETIKNHPRLSELSILRMAQGTNFPVRDRERDALDELLSRPPSPAISRKLCLIGTWKTVEDSIDEVTRKIREKGGWASAWSFPIKQEAIAELGSPFYLYINAGSGRIPARLRISKFVTSRGNEGQVSPWPEITNPEWVGQTRVNDEVDVICKTWLWVDEISALSPELDIMDFEAAPGLSVPEGLLSAVTFGYAVLRASNPMDKLIAHTLLDRSFLEQIVSALKTPALGGGSPQIVLAGPPGTSKTWVAEAIALYVSSERKRVQLVQFHSNYSYEAFVEGLRPTAKAGGISFELQPGALLGLVSEMKSAGEIGASSPLYCLVIDEMNRANLPRVFGELMYLFEYREKSIRLQYSDNFALPQNLRFIGTMNTADRSIRSIDIALRRRFDVFELRPDAAVLRRYFEKNPPSSVPNLIEGFEKLNRQLEDGLDRHHTIGHAFFMKPGLDHGMLRAIWDRKIYPLIEEYFFDQLDIAKREYSFEQFWPE